MIRLIYVAVAIFSWLHTAYCNIFERFRTGFNISALDAAQIASELSPLLSHDAAIWIPDDTERWRSLTSRQSWPRVSPGYLAVVEVASEEDIQETVKYANSNVIPFLAVSTGHGWTTTLNDLQNGLQISMRKLQSVEVSEDERTAKIGGGATQNTTLKSLAVKGKRAVTGLCECTSTIGPTLGGGHSMIQSLYGFAADNLVSARVVLGNGTIVAASETENEDLFWALCGAGHNFGIISSFEVKIYDVPPSEAGLWTITSMIFTHDKLESFFETWNTLEASHPDPGLLILHSVFVHNPAIDPTDPIIISLIFHEGSNPIAEEYIAFFKSLSPISFNQESSIPWIDLHDKAGMGQPPVCLENANFFVTPSSFASFNVDSIRRGFDIWSNFTTTHEQFAGSNWLLESYGRGQVARVPVEATAVAAERRENHILVGVNLNGQGDDVEDRRVAEEFAVELRNAIQMGSEVDHTYVNYATGKESMADMYGRDEARLEILKKLKRKWDPDNRFGFYAPII